MTVVLPGELSQHPYPGVPGPGDELPAQAPLARVPLRRPRVLPAIGFGLLLLFGAVVPIALAMSHVNDRYIGWEYQLPMEQANELTLAPRSEALVWAPERHAESLTCEAMSSVGTALPMVPAMPQDHDDYVAVWRFATGNGEVSLTCTVAQDGSGGAPTSTIWLGEEPDLTYLPALQTTLLLFGGALVIAAVVPAVVILAQPVHLLRSLSTGGPRAARRGRSRSSSRGRRP
ncbi:hypothetical protein EDD31_0651 [Bogoriella caseilytica]|uniref:Uncharacterized protein n=1 Tax=Bogoriella caseilytica TaxID=56055 RepID=A0A3N2BAK3_9MICO|nr:hypothetical protein EDD31_0651 [Bogoriella caseilytica]